MTNPWSERETILVDQCILFGLGAKASLRYFPSRSILALAGMFDERRDVLDLSKVRDTTMIEAKGKPKFVVYTSPIPERKLVTTFTPEAEGCRDLLKRMLETGHHWIHDPARYLEARKEAGL